MENEIEIENIMSSIIPTASEVITYYRNVIKRGLELMW